MERVRAVYTLVLDIWHDEYVEVLPSTWVQELVGNIFFINIRFNPFVKRILNNQYLVIFVRRAHLPNYFVI